MLRNRLSACGKTLWRTAVAAERMGEVTNIGTRNREAAERNSDRSAIQQEIKVLQIDEVKARIDTKRQQEQPRPQEEIYAAFYTRHAAMTQAYDAKHGQQEQQLRAEAADHANN